MSKKMATVKTLYPQAKADRLARLARRNERSLAAEIRIALDRHLSSDAHPEGERP